MSDSTSHLFLSPPVIQQAGCNGFVVSIEVSQLCTGRVEWGWHADCLDHVAEPAFGGLVDASDTCLMISVVFPEPVPAGRSVFYRVVGSSLAYDSAYELRRGQPERTEVRALRLPHPEQASVRLAIVNDTHGFAETASMLAARVESLSPDLLVWNGDVCSHFSAGENPAAVLLRPGGGGESPSAGGWASERPLLYVPGNHDVRGENARLRPSILAPAYHSELPYCSALRIGPLALVSLDTGEDKPDRHPVFANTAAYEPYRVRQSVWLAEQLTGPDLADAPFKIAFAHIPLRGLSGENDGTLLVEHARYSGEGAALWLPHLVSAGVQAIISGHTHEWRVDQPTESQPITQIVGGGPKAADATVIVVEAGAEELVIRIEGLDGELYATETWQAG